MSTFLSRGRRNRAGRLFFLGASFLLAMSLRAQPPAANVWENVQTPQSRGAAQDWVRPKKFRALSLNHGALGANLRRALPETAQRAVDSQTLISLPMPDGSLARFRFVESSVMEPELAAKFPEIKTYSAQGVDDPSATARFDLTPAGFHAQILSPRGAVYIDPYFRGDTSVYASYYKRDHQRSADDFQCLVAGRDAEGSGQAAAQAAPPTSSLVSGANLRTYRLACAATAEYTAFHGGTVSAGLAAIVTAVNRVTGVYEAEVAIRLVLVASNNLIVYTNVSSQPYSNGNASLMLSQNQSNLDAVIGSANYDIGHVFGTAGGGLAQLGVVCANGSKARGETATSSPIGDAFYIDYVAHEIGHQFGANHTFNSPTGNCTANRNGSTAYEVGSGSTIMAYAGICGTDNLQAHSDPYFHSASLDEIAAYSTNGTGNSCAVLSSTSNSPPTVSAGTNFVIPKSTPFTLTATGSDPNGDTLTYCWEERDLGPAATVTAPDNGSSPLFRSFNPTTNASRTFPRLSDILGNTNSIGEMLPTTNRTMSFRVVARDNRAGGGGINTSNVQVIVASNSGPFVVTAPNSAVTWSNMQTVTWNVAGTTNAPVNTTNVNIHLSTNGGLAFQFLLATNTPNDGSQLIQLPNLSSTNARVKVEAAANIFFDISNTNLTIIPFVPVPFVTVSTNSIEFENCFSTNSLVDPGETVTMAFSLTNSGNANTTNLVVTLLATNGVTSPSEPQAYGAIVAGGAAVSRTFTFTASGSCGGMVTPTFQLQDGGTSYPQLSRVMPLGTSTNATQNLTNASAITIVDNAAASPYPATNVVSGMTGAVTKVTVGVRGLTHTFLDDIDMLLVGPLGQKVLLMSDAGGNNGATGIDITFDDSAVGTLSDTLATVSGTYKPGNFDTGTDVFPAPAPSSPFGSLLSDFNGLNPNGTWSLYVRDDEGGDTGSIAQGWTLSITTSNGICCSGIVPIADIGVTQTVAAATVNVGSNVTFTTMVTNFGPHSATSVTVTDAIPATLTFVGATVSQGTWSTNGGSVATFSLGTMTNGASASLTLTASTAAAGQFTNVMAATTTAIDQSSTNNNSATAFSVNAFPTISAITNQTIPEDSSTPSLDFVIGDAETPAGSLSVTGACSNTNLAPNENIAFGGSASNRTITVTPALNQSGTTTVSIAVSDGMAVSIANFSLVVTPVNDAPVLTAITNYVVNEGDIVTFVASATDIESPPQILTFSLSNAPPGAVINPTNGLFAWTPSEADGPGTNTITVIVSDDGSPALSDTRIFEVTVHELNVPPGLPVQPERTIAGITPLTVTNTATDTDLPTNSLTYLLSVMPTNAVIDTNGIITWTPESSQVPSTNVFETIVTDNNPDAVNVQQLSATNSFTVVVNAIHNGPSLAGLSDRTISELVTLVVTNTASDSDLPPLTLTYQLENAPAGALIDTNGVITWTPDETQGPATNSMTTIVTDNGEPPLSATNTFNVHVNEINIAPTLASQTNFTISGMASLVVTNTAYDTDVPANPLSYLLALAPWDPLESTCRHASLSIL